MRYRSITKPCRTPKSGRALRTIRESGAAPATTLALEFLVLTAARSKEVRDARWEEIDGATWTIPGERMKKGREHRVPLSSRALEVLAEARPLSNGSGLVFPSSRGGSQSDGTLSQLVKNLKIKAVPHGFRSSFRDWAAECSTAPGRSASWPWPTSTTTGRRRPIGGAICSRSVGN